MQFHTACGLLKWPRTNALPYSLWPIEVNIKMQYMQRQLRHTPGMLHVCLSYTA